MTLNAVIALILRFFSPNSTDFQADYITVVEGRPIYVRKILSPSSNLLLLAKTITHPAARWARVAEKRWSGARSGKPEVAEREAGFTEIGWSAEQLYHRSRSAHMLCKRLISRWESERELFNANVVVHSLLQNTIIDSNKFRHSLATVRRCLSQPEAKHQNINESNGKAKLKRAKLKVRKFK